jgi:hypothetical protein
MTDMSGLNQGPPQGIAVPGGDDYIDLDLTGVDAIQGWLPVPNGVYVLQIADAKIVPAKDPRNKNIEFRDVVAEGPLTSRSIGIDRIFVPNRETQTPEAYEKTAGFFKGKLEAITGRPYSGRINVREMIGLKFKAVVMMVDEGYGLQNKINNYLPLTADTSGIVVPQTAPVPRPQQNSGSNGGGAVQDTAAAGRFRI